MTLGYYSNAKCFYFKLSITFSPYNLQMIIFRIYHKLYCVVTGFSMYFSPISIYSKFLCDVMHSGKVTVTEWLPKPQPMWAQEIWLEMSD